ncbi:hypothetical protein HYT23_04615 [Candidatus Pacearchaeota archaeon]|nr:hypothetical protein [Candidatus Pacearchaeota archaeon]
MDDKLLEKIGLTKNQSIVYMTLLKLGSTNVLNIIKESGLHRSRIYDSLEKLHQLGLVTYVIKDFKKYFQATEPGRLFDYVNEQREFIKEILPDLKKLEGLKKEDIGASIYKGKEGLKAIHMDMLKENKEIYVLGAKGLIFEQLPYFVPHFEKERIKRKMKFICLFDKKDIKNELTKKSLITGKTLPDGYDSNSVINIYGGKVAIVLWKERYPTAFKINNKDIANSFRKWFRLIYDSIK